MKDISSNDTVLDVLSLNRRAKGQDVMAGRSKIDVNGTTSIGY
nr:MULTISPECIES: hypothetical protein [unclassified Allomuricauda]